VKPDDEIGRADGSKVSSPSHFKFFTKIDQDPEYQSKHLEYPRDRPIYRRPPSMLHPTEISSSGRSSTCFVRPTHHRERRAFEYEPTSEVRSQYVPYGYVPRTDTLKMPANLRLEGNYELQPEYRNAHCARYDRQSCGEPRTICCDKADRNSSASRRRENYWLTDNNVGQCDRTITQDLDAFRVLNTRNTRFHEDNVTSKPPLASRRCASIYLSISERNR